LIRPGFLIPYADPGTESVSSMVLLTVVRHHFRQQYGLTYCYQDDVSEDLIAHKTARQQQQAGPYCRGFLMGGAFSLCVDFSVVFAKNSPQSEKSTRNCMKSPRDNELTSSADRESRLSAAEELARRSLFGCAQEPFRAQESSRRYGADKPPICGNAPFRRTKSFLHAELLPREPEKSPWERPQLSLTGEISHANPREPESLLGATATRLDPRNPPREPEKSPHNGCRSAS
jgi:hypothetical protein